MRWSGAKRNEAKHDAENERGRGNKEKGVGQCHFTCGGIRCQAERGQVCFCMPDGRVGVPMQERGANESGDRGPEGYNTRVGDGGRGQGPKVSAVEEHKASQGNRQKGNERRGACDARRGGEEGVNHQ